MSDHALVELRSVHKVYDRDGAAVRALDGIDFTLRRGEHVALLGPSGSGKSTLLHLLGCLDVPTSGEHRLNGRDVAGFDDLELALARRAVGFVFQAFHLLARGTAVENAALPLRYAGVPRAPREARAAEVLRRVGLGDRLAHRPAELSGGQQQRVAIARALVHDPALLLCDEPTGNLDSRAGSEIVQLLEQLAAEGRTLVVVTHDEALAARARRIVRMRDGRIESDTG
jgi:putative ABC transport system ATP-binding protein